MHREHFWLLLLFTMQNMYLVLFIFVFPSYMWKYIDSHIINWMGAERQELQEPTLYVRKKEIQISLCWLWNTYKSMFITFRKKGYFFYHLVILGAPATVLLKQHYFSPCSLGISWMLENKVIFPLLCIIMLPCSHLTYTLVTFFCCC